MYIASLQCQIGPSFKHRDANGEVTCNALECGRTYSVLKNGDLAITDVALLASFACNSILEVGIVNEEGLLRSHLPFHLGPVKSNRGPIVPLDVLSVFLEESSQFLYDTDDDDAFFTVRLALTYFLDGLAQRFMAGQILNWWQCVELMVHHTVIGSPLMSRGQVKSAQTLLEPWLREQHLSAETVSHILEKVLELRRPPVRVLLKQFCQNNELAAVDTFYLQGWNKLRNTIVHQGTFPEGSNPNVEWQIPTMNFFAGLVLLKWLSPTTFDKVKPLIINFVHQPKAEGVVTQDALTGKIFVCVPTLVGTYRLKAHEGVLPYVGKSVLVYGNGVDIKVAERGVG